MHYSLRNHFGRTYWYSKVKRLKWKVSSMSLDIVLILFQDRMQGLHGTYHMLRNQFRHLMELLDDMCHMKSRLGRFGYSVNLDAR